MASSEISGMTGMQRRVRASRHAARAGCGAVAGRAAARQEECYAEGDAHCGCQESKTPVMPLCQIFVDQRRQRSAYTDSHIENGIDASASGIIGFI